MTTMSADEITRIVERAVDLTLQRFGVDTDNAAATRADFVHLRRWRLAIERSATLVLTTVVGTLTTGILGAIYLVFLRHA